MRISDLLPSGLTEVLTAQQSASFLRLGDGELRFLLEAQSGKWEDNQYDRYQRRASPDEATGTLGLTRKDYERLIAAYRGCSVLDVYGEIPYNREYLSQVEFNRPGSMLTVSSTPDNPLLNAWTVQEFRAFLGERRTIICGAEARLQENLLRHPVYRDCAREFWPESASVEFVQPPDDGRNLSQNLDQTKELLLNRIQKTRSDVVLLSLGGAAKILCFEIAHEANVCAVDWGSMLRAFTYSGSDGFANWRSSHNPFLFRVPLYVYFPTLLESYPRMPAEWYLGKAHCQLILDLHAHEVGRIHPADVHDSSSRSFSDSNLKDFSEDYEYYLREVLPQFKADSGMVNEFHNWLIRNRVPVKIDVKWRIGYQANRVLKKLATVVSLARKTSS